MIESIMSKSECLRLQLHSAGLDLLCKHLLKENAGLKAELNTLKCQLDAKRKVEKKVL